MSPTRRRAVTSLGPITSATTAVPRRIHVIGGEATGKTTLSRRLGELLDAPVHNLDGVAWIIGESDVEVLDPQYQPSVPVTPRPIEERRRLVEEIAGQAGWVTEGKYIGWTQPLLDAADLVVFLDHVGTIRALARIVARAGRSALREMRRQRGIKRFIRPFAYVRHGFELLGQIWHRVRYSVASTEPEDADAEPTRAAVLASLRPLEHKLVHIRDASQVDELVGRLTAIVTRTGAPGPKELV